MNTRLFNIEEKIIAISGSTGVLGTIMTRALLNEGAKLALLDRNPEKSQLIEESKNTNWQLKSYKTNVLDERQVKEACKAVVEDYGQIDILINAVGGNIPGSTIGPDQNVLDLSIDGTREVLDLNYMGTVIPTQAFLQPMIERKRGTIINISSMSAQQPLTRVMGYSSAKAAIDNYTKWLAVEMASKFGEGFNVNAIAPGFFLTNQNRTLLTNEDGSLTERGQQIIDHTPFKRFGDPEELIGTLLWLCSDASKFVTGTIIPVDGGFSAYSGV
ncbi:MAG: SDR family oxidoreductase [Bacteroidota bacterium]